MSNLGRKLKVRVYENIPWPEIQTRYDSGITLRCIGKEFDVTSWMVSLATKRGHFKPRNRANAARLAHLGMKTSASTKAKISAKMKRAHEDGRAYNIGKCRWKKTPSYPESFFLRVVQNEFIDKNVTRELWVGKFVLDFAWPHKLKVIEIDGDQHTRFDEQIARDKRKDAYLTSKGWSVLRLRWSNVCIDARREISKAKDFIA
jgi:very-short-patch-repair endonuclease